MVAQVLLVEEDGVEWGRCIGLRRVGDREGTKLHRTVVGPAA
jgi:hypothetical protein